MIYPKLIKRFNKAILVIKEKSNNKVEWGISGDFEDVINILLIAIANIAAKNNLSKDYIKKKFNDVVDNLYYQNLK